MDLRNVDQLGLGPPIPEYLIGRECHKYSKPKLSSRKATGLVLVTYRNEICENSKLGCQVWWHTPVIPALRRLRQEDCKFKVCLGFIVRPHLKKPRAGV
jgi:hypothetical protein